MNTARFEELLACLLESELSDTEADELAKELNGAPERRRELRQHLVLWEVWSQSHAPERSAESFVDAWKTRLRAENENADAFAHAVRERLESRETMTPWAGALQRLLSPARIAWSSCLMILALGIGLWLWLALPRSSHAMTVHGEAVCTACVLHQSHEHIPVIRVQDGTTNRFYYLNRNSAVRPFQDYFCSGPAPVTATGTVRTEKGRLLFEADSVTIPEPNKPQSTNDGRILFPL